MAQPTQRVVLITGAAGNLGKAVARAMAEEGAALALVDQDEARLEQVRGALGLPPARCMHLCADVTDGDSSRGLCEAVLARMGRIDVLVNGAGGFRMGPLPETSEEVWDHLMDLNARSVFNLSRILAPLMVKQGAGRIINVGARPALQGLASLSVYAASKAAVLRLSESLAAELLGTGVTVNSVLPSIIDTPQNRQAMPDADYARWVRPESLAGVIRFLASHEARDISGAAIPVYGSS